MPAVSKLWFPATVGGNVREDVQAVCNGVYARVDELGMHLGSVPSDAN